MQKTHKITVTGRVQGIGYRPFVAELAESIGVTGMVRNESGIVIMIVSGEEELLALFYRHLQSQCPIGGKINQIMYEEMELTPFDCFTIEISKENVYNADMDTKIPVILPDLPVCDDCIKEMEDPQNRRYRYPLISCTSCGPRYSILHEIPYDRQHTVMNHFPLCSDCAKDYTQKSNKRRHAQTIACNDCGPQLSFTFIKNGQETETIQAKAALDRAVELLKDGGVLAIKDIGGFHLACSAYEKNAVEEIRKMKGRERKPLAVMFSDCQDAEAYCEMTKEHERLLVSDSRPVVLIPRKMQCRNLCMEEICKHSPEFGVILPCNPLQVLLVKECGPLVMTSANRSQELMIIQDETMRVWMQNAVAKNVVENAVEVGILGHNRSIVTPLDDSVMRVVCGRTQVLRRARGIVPDPISLHQMTPQIFAAGGDLKSVFCYAADGKGYLSQPFGDLMDLQAMEEYTRQKGRMKNLFGFRPVEVAIDTHPRYLSSENGTEYARINQNSLHKIQHHHAHVASVAAEHGLHGTFIGVAFDGTGYGENGEIWGSEIFVCHDYRYRRAAHLAPVKIMGTDQAVRNTDHILYGYLSSLDSLSQWKQENIVPTWFDWERAELVSRAIESGMYTVSTSSMGRLFDAVSALLGICHNSHYEGEAAIELEYCAARADIAYPLHIELQQSAGEEGLVILGDTKPLFQAIINGLSQHVPIGQIALGFLSAVKSFIVECCKILSTVEQQKSGNAIPSVALSGGTFQNRILMEQTIQELETSGFAVYINEQVPPGDGGLCLGQVYLAGIKRE